jgi:hypothetical protein
MPDTLLLCYLDTIVLLAKDRLSIVVGYPITASIFFLNQQPISNRQRRRGLSVGLLIGGKWCIKELYEAKQG